ncbi:pseudouridine synthase [Candidatus Bathyarchaeota archaeon]|nr:MAG: pseudouridine synthase [Candidatus Bathyarchaeota archaeon]
MVEKFMKNDVLQKVRCIADYQFGKDAGKTLFPDNIEVKFSGRTGRVKEIYVEKKLVATLRPTVGNFSLTIEGFKRLLKTFKYPKFRVVVTKEAEEFVRKGKNVFAKHVKNVDKEIRPMDEVAVVNENDQVIAVGKAVLSGREMLAFKRGIAVKVRHGVEKSDNQR